MKSSVYSVHFQVDFIGSYMKWNVQLALSRKLTCYYGNIDPLFTMYIANSCNILHACTAT